MIASGVPALPYDDSAGFTAPPAFGTFRVLHQIGSGVLGPVFRTFEPHAEKLVAIKAFRLDVVPEVTARLADALRRLTNTPLTHPAIVPVVEAGLEGTTAYLAYEYVAADTLDVSLKQLAPARVEAALPLLRQLAEAIEAAWAAGVGHGALHPRDIFVVAPDDVRVTGFGVVPALERLQIKTPLRRPYTAPERATGGGWDIRADVFSLGVIAHELLTGRRPAGPDEQDGELPTGTTPEQRVAIRRALGSVLSADPARRYATPTAFVDALVSGDVVEIPVVPEVPEVPEMAEVAEVPLNPGLPFEELTPAMPEMPEMAEMAEMPAMAEMSAMAATSEMPDADDMAEPVDHVMSGAHMYEPPSYDAPLYRGVLPPPPATPAGAALAGMLVLGLLVGGGLGYWWRGPAEVRDVDGPLPVTEVIADEPIGTEVRVAPPTPPVEPQAPVSSPETRPAAAATRGRLLVRTVPAGATVSINGRARGTSPATIRDLAFGTYNVAVTRAGYQRRVQRVTINAAVPARDVTIELTRTAASAPPAAAATTGSVFVETRPVGATVTIDGRSVGLAPVLVPDLAPGTHTIRLDLAGHRSVTTTVVVRAGQRTPVRASLEIQ